MDDDTHSIDRRPWATKKGLASGDRVEVDGGFTCIKPGLILTVRGDEHGLYIPCASGQHYLDGQLNDAGAYVGLWVAP